MKERISKKISLLSVCILAFALLAGLGIAAFATHTNAHAQTSSIHITPKTVHVSGQNVQLKKLNTYQATKSTHGAFTQFKLQRSTLQLVNLTKGPDGAYWTTDLNGYIERVTTNGTVTEYQRPSSVSNLYEIVTVGDGSIWFFFSDGGISKFGLVRLNTNGSATVFTLPQSIGVPDSLIKGPDGALWFSNSYQKVIVRASNSGDMQVYTLPLDTQYVSLPLGTGYDGALWFAYTVAGQAPLIGHLSLTGTFTSLSLPNSFENYINSIAQGPDGAMWFLSIGKIGRITASGSVKTYNTPSQVTSVYSIINVGNNKLAYSSNMEVDHGDAQNYIVTLNTNGTTAKVYTLPAYSPYTNISADNLISGNNNTIWYGVGASLFELSLS